MFSGWLVARRNIWLQRCRAGCYLLCLMTASNAVGQMVGDGQALVDPILIDPASFDPPLIDPTKPAGWVKKPVVKFNKGPRPNVRVDYIIYSKLRRLVSINGQSLAEGDNWNDVKVVKVEPQRVLLAWRGQQWFSSIASSGRVSRKSAVIRRTE